MKYEFNLVVHQAVGRVDGTVTLYELRFPPVHCLFRERYAYRDQLSDVVVCHLLANQRGLYSRTTFNLLLVHLYSIYICLLSFRAQQFTRNSSCAARIKCKDLVQKVALYEKRVAVCASFQLV